MEWGRGLKGVTLLLVAALPTGSYAGESIQIGDMTLTVQSFLRAETAIRTTGEENPSNQGGNTKNGSTIARTAYLPPALAAGAVTWGDVPFAVAGAGFADTIRRGDFIDADDNALNWTSLRFETEGQLSINSNFSLIGRLRAVYDPNFYQQFSASDAANDPDNLQGSVDGGSRALYRGKPNLFEYHVEGGGHAIPLEWTGKDYQIYLPALVMDYTSGGTNIRVGNQQIAWGQSIFFRVFDVPNGLDFRRHLILDRGLEEFSDKRQPQLSIRATVQATDTLLVDSYVAKFQPTIYPNPNTPYNIIPSQFTVHDLYKEGGYDNKLNYGIRVKAEYGGWGWQAMAVRRYNPDGTFEWTKSGVNKSLSGPLGNIVNSVYNAKAPYSGVGECDPMLCRRYADSGEAMANSPFEASPGGVFTADEWFDYAAQARLNGLTGLNASIEEFLGSQDLFGTSVDLPTYLGGDVSFEESRRQAAAELNTFFMAAGGGFRGHLARKYHREDDFGLGASYVNESDNPFLNQLIFNVEAQYTPKRNYTRSSLSNNQFQQDEYTVSLVVDKWHRFFDSFPGTYIVFQALTKNRSDLAGRNLKGYGNSQHHVGDGLSGNANYIVAGFLQPWPNKLFALEFASLYDVRGGVLMQPLLQWNAGNNFVVEGFYTWINGDLYGDTNDNFVSTANFANEASIRITKTF